MKKFTAIILAVMMFATLALTATAAETFTDDFSADLANWDGAGGPSIIDGALVLGSGEWTTTGYEVAPKFSAEKYTATFDISGDKRDCYYGFGIRCFVDAFGDLNNGGRNDIPQAIEIGYGVSVDIFSKGTDCADKIVVGFNAGEMGSSPTFKIPYPAGYDSGVATKFKVVDNGTDFELYLGETLLCKVALSVLNETNEWYTKAVATAADGSALGTFDNVKVLKIGRLNFYQRNNRVTVDNVSITAAAGGSTPPTPPAPTGDVAVIAIASVAVIALAGAVVCKKVRA